MNATEFIDSRLPQWRTLDRLCDEMEAKRRKISTRQRVEFAALYRSACADLALADANQLPERTVRYLHRLVARAHNQLYRSKRFEVSRWYRVAFREVPRQLFHDRYLRLAFALFWGGFLLSAFLASRYSPVPGYAEAIAGEEFLVQIEDMYTREPFSERDFFSSGLFDPEGALMVGYYIFHNTSIGLRCFVMGLVFGVGGLFATIFNALLLGAVFGYMSTMPDGVRANFFEFVTAHGPFELNAIVLSAAAGMRLGFSLVSTRGKTRLQAIMQAGREALPIMSVAVALFFLAALIEGFFSPSPAPLLLKRFFAGVCTVLLLAYVLVLGTMEYGDESSPSTSSPAAGGMQPAGG